MGIDSAPLLITRSLQGQQIVAAHLKSGLEHIGAAEPIPPEDAWAVGVALCELPHYEMWSKGRPLYKGGFLVNSMRIGNLAEQLTIRTFQPSEAIVIHVPRTALDEITNEEGFSRIGDLACLPGVVDPIMAELARVLRVSFDQPEETSPLFIDQVILSVCSHLIGRYGDNVRVSATMSRKGSLAAAHVRRAKEMLAGNLAGNLRIAEIAKECGVSRQYLITSFKKVEGCTPSQWWRQRGVDRARDMLKNTTLRIHEIASLCGFTSHNQLTKVFADHEGITPAAWRRQN